MTQSDIIRAWKDPHYRAGLSANPGGAAAGPSRRRHRAARADAARGAALCMLTNAASGRRTLVWHRAFLHAEPLPAGSRTPGERLWRPCCVTKTRLCVGFVRLHICTQNSIDTGLVATLLSEPRQHVRVKPHGDHLF